MKLMERRFCGSSIRRAVTLWTIGRLSRFQGRGYSGGFDLKGSER